MSNAILVQNVVQAVNIDSLNRPAMSATDDIQNGNVFTFNGKSTTAGYDEVWNTVQPATANGLKLSLKLLGTTYISIADGSIGSQRQTAYQFEVVDNTTGIWMAYEPEVVVTVSGTNKFKGIDSDPRNFINLAGTPFTAFKPQVGDILTLSTDGITGTIGTNTYAVATNSQYALSWAASAN